MNEFTFKRRYKNKYGSVEYECECHVCGKTCYYHRSIKTKPICFDCQKKNVRKQNDNRQDMKAVARFWDWLFEHYDIQVDADDVLDKYFEEELSI